MKKVLRVIVPLLLSLTIIACAAWYLLVYDQAFTKEVLLNQARRFEASGHHQISAFIYDVAYYQSHKDDAVAIELAQQYLDIENFTKAEYTLTNAIRSNPSAELYAALSKVFVMQDKLLDAVNLLAGVSDPAIAKELDAMRPKMPVLTPEPNFFSEYITVEVHCDGADLYVSTDADYPSMTQDAYQGPITLPIGETVIYAIAVNSDGLVSPLNVGGYTIQGVVELVTFADPAMEAVIRAAVEATPTEPIYTNRLWAVNQITVPAEATTYEDLQHLTRLTSLTIHSNSKGDLAILEQLGTLQELHLDQIRLGEEDIQRISNLTELKVLTLSGCSLSNINAFSGLTKLTWLDLSSNTLRNINALSGMTAMEHLNLSNNVVNTLDPLSKLTKLRYLDVSYNAVASLAPLKDFSLLNTLIASNNQIASVADLSGLLALETLDVSHNNLEDIQPLETLSELIELKASNNALTSMVGLQRLMHLRILDLSYNQITELPVFQKTCELVNINMSHNLLQSVDLLADLPWLNTVNVDYNEEISDLLPLDTCPVLIRVNAYGTNVTEVSFLLEKSIIVNFDPTLAKED